MRARHVRRRPAAAAALALALALAACSGGEADGTGTTGTPTDEATSAPGGSTPEEESPTEDGAIGPDHTGELPDGVDLVENTSELNAITVGEATAAGEISAECLGNELGMVVSLLGGSGDHGDLSAVLSFQDGALTSVVVQSTTSPDGAPYMWMTSAGPGEELTVTAEEDDGVWMVTGSVGGIDALTQAPLPVSEMSVTADCRP